MKANVYETAEQLGQFAAKEAAEVLQKIIAKKGNVRLVLSTGASQFEVLESLLEYKIDWEKVEMFHLDEYVNLPETHPASFRKYLKERFLNGIRIGKAHLVNGEGDVRQHIASLTNEITKAPIDLALIGIGENAHIAFNDPPADFDSDEAYKIVTLDDACKMQQIREGWFASIEEVPKEAITMSVKQILRSEKIISCVPHEVKAQAIQLTLENDVTSMIPATILKTHKNWSLYLDSGSASRLKSEWQTSL